MIVKENNKYILYSEDKSKHLGTFYSRGAAKKREMQINYFKNKDD